MTKFLPAALRPYAKPDATLLPLGLALLAILPAMLGWGWFCLVLLSASSIASALTLRTITPLRELLALGGFFEVTIRALRLAVLLLLGARIWTDTAIAIPFALGGLAIVVMSIFTEITVSRLATRLTPEIYTRNLPIAAGKPPFTAKVLADGLALVVPELLIIFGASLITRSVLLAWLIAVLAVLTMAVGTLATDKVLRTKGAAFRARAISDVQRAIKDHHAQVALYLGLGSSDTVYQLEGWLATAEDIPQETIVIVRSVPIFHALGKTSLPVIALTNSQDLLLLDLTNLRACLFVSNTGDIIHLLREQNPMSAFIGHGDSDKSSSFNPFTKVYDEVWVAGQAGADRYSRAMIGLRPEQFVSVGRPQLDAIDLTALPSTSDNYVPTVLYAPTWEGWNADQEYCSLLGQGARIVEQLLASPQRIRLIYKPHPFTGIRDPKARATSDRIIAMIRSANERAGLNATEATPSKPSQAQSATEANELATAAGNKFFASLAPDAHVVVRPNSGLGIFQCFEHADALITDISSVLSDFIATGRPYAVCNPGTDSADDFVREFPSARGGMIIDRDGAGTGDFLNVVAAVTPDPKVEVRAEVREYLLGPSEPTASARFNEAITALIERANRRIEARNAGSQS